MTVSSYQEPTMLMQAVEVSVAATDPAFAREMVDRLTDAGLEDLARDYMESTQMIHAKHVFTDLELMRAGDQAESILKYGVRQCADYVAEQLCREPKLVPKINKEPFDGTA